MFPKAKQESAHVHSQLTNMFAKFLVCLKMIPPIVFKISWKVYDASMIKQHVEKFKLKVLFDHQ